MRFLRLTFLALPFLFAVMAGLLADDKATILDGKKVFTDQKCQMCHGVSSAGIQATTKSEKLKGPDLTGKPASQDATKLADVLRKKSNTSSGKPHPKAFTGTDEELGAMIAWLQKQKAE